MSETKERHAAISQNRDLVDHLHALGPDILAEFLVEAVDPLDLAIELSRYARLDPRDLCGAGGMAGCAGRSEAR